MGTKPSSKEEAVLLDLCVRFGYCRPATEQIEILSRSDPAPADLVDAVIVAEGLDPTTVRSRTQMVELAEQIFRSPAWSGEP
ncbi:MAG: hypothetical protein ACTHN0_05055 [Aquihabitans sp.]